LHKENEPLQAPVSRYAFQEWANRDRHEDLYVRQASGKVLGFHRYDILPEVYLLFAGDPEHMYETMDPCGLYDKKTREFRFVNRTMSACVDGLSETELWNRNKQGPNLMQLVGSYGKNAVEQGGYKVDRTDVRYDELRRTVFSGLNAMASYAGMLAAKGEDAAVLDLRDLALDMHPFWQDFLYSEYQKAGNKQERQYQEKFDGAVSLARESGKPPSFGIQKVSAMLKALRIHAEEELYGNENRFAVWQCSQLAKRLRSEYPFVRTGFGQNFPLDVDYSERFTRFGCRDCEHLDVGQLLGQDVLMFSDPIPENAVPEGWYCYHLAGRNIMKADRLLTSMPEDYVGTVLSPCSLTDTGQSGLQLCLGSYENVTLTEFCEKLHLPEPDLSGIFPDQRQTAGMGGMSL